MSRLYESIFRHALYPAYESVLRRRKTLRYLREYEQNQWLDAEQIQALQWHKLKRLVEYCWNEVPYYRDRWQQAGATPADIRTLDDYARLPVLTKQDIRDNFEQMIAPSQRAGLLYKATGGSTGEPLRFGYTRESYERRVAVMFRGYAWSGMPLGRRTLYLWGGAVGSPSRTALLKDEVYHRIFHRRMLNSFTMRDDELGRYADAIAAYKPDGIVAYTGPLVRLSQWLNAQGRTIRGVRSILGAAEALHDFQRPIIEQAFPDARAFNTYGCREFMLIASECEHRDGLHVNADHLVVELAGDRTGGGGDVVVTDLGNYGMPLLRYVNGDRASPHTGGACACGRGLPRIGRVEGRKLDAIRTMDGNVLPGEFFPHMLKDVAGVRRFQLVQRSLDSIVLSIVPGAGFDDTQAAYIRDEVAKVIGHGTSVELRLVDDIPLTASGKLRVTISELS